MKSVGVVIATYNGEKYLEEQLDSILGQSHGIQQIVVVDDSSSDDTRDIIKSYQKKYPDLFKVFKNDFNKGPSETFGKGISKCGTDYIALSDQDDIWAHNKIEKLFRALNKNKHAKMCFHDLEIINPKGKLRANSYWRVAPPTLPLPVVGQKARERVLSFSNPVPGCTMLFDSSLKQHILPIPDSNIGHDWWISCNAFFWGEPIYIDAVLGKYRLHPDQAAGIGITLKKKRDEIKKYSFDFCIKREVRRFFFRKKILRETLLSKKKSKHLKVKELIKIIERCEDQTNFKDRKHEYENYKIRLMDLMTSNGSDILYWFNDQQVAISGKSFLRQFYFYRDYLRLKDQKKTSKQEFAFGKNYPCLKDRFETSGSFSGHYFYQDLFVANKIFQKKPVKHVDIGSRVDGFIAHVASFREIEVFDVRPTQIHLRNVIFKQFDFMNASHKLVDYCDSISSLHAIEHFGLGRYGDRVDYYGYLKGLDNIYVTLKTGGIFYFSVPIGKQRIEFNAHRIFSINYLLELLRDNYLIDSFSYVDDKGDFYEDVPLSPRSIKNNFNCNYGCGIFVLVKK